ncbi:MAG: UbiA family prenyltransferase, partial [Planctomycetota bacterium]|nr:UbiA family prenyltransferase [Planctomycetota bacterium]
FDRGAGLHSIPGRFGVAAALSASAALHVVTVVALLGTAFLAGLGLPFLVALALASALLVWEHRLVRPDDLSRVDAAFFTINGWVSVALFLGLALDLAL